MATLSARQPKVRFVLVCQRIIKEEGTGLVSLISVFRELSAKSLPLTMDVHVYAPMADAQGSYEFRLEIVRVRDEQKIAEFKIPLVTIPDPTAVGDLTAKLTLAFKETGTYDIRLWANQWFLDHAEIGVKLVKSK